MGRQIKLKFYDKEYIIEYANRTEVKRYFAEAEALKGKEDFESGVKATLLLIKAGLVEHHFDEMPSDKDIENWITIMPNADKFYERLMSMVQEVITVIENDAKNLNWEEVN